MTTSLTRSSDTPGAVAALMQAVESKDPRILELLLNAREKWQADEARGLFNSALVRFQQKVPIIAKADVADGKAYAKMDRIWREIRPLMEECGLAVSWESVRPVNEVLILDGHLRHIAGHAQPIHYELPMPKPITSREGKQVQNVAQAMGSATTYAKRYATCAVLGIQTGEDDDGRLGAIPASPAAVARLREALKARGSDEAQACQVIGVRTLDDATADQIVQLATMMAARTKRTPAAEPAGAHVPTRAESLAAIAAASAIRRTAALKSRDLTPDNYTSAPDDILAEVAGMLNNKE